MRMIALLLLLAFEASAQWRPFSVEHVASLQTSVPASGGGGGGGLTNGVIAYWPLDEVDGSVDVAVTRVDSVGGNDLSDGTSSTGVYSTNGVIGNAAYFRTGASPRLLRADNAALSGGDVSRSFSCLVYLDSLPSSGQGRTFISKYLITGNQREYALHCENSGGTTRFKFAVSSNGTGVTSVAADNFGTPTTATWYRIYAHHDAANDQILISVNNGTPNTAVYSSGIFDGTGDFMLGSLNLTGNYFQHGRIDEVRIWNHVLTVEERAELDDLLTP